jgi:Uncharacterized protein conserved in bacteria
MQTSTSEEAAATSSTKVQKMAATTRIRMVVKMPGPALKTRPDYLPKQTKMDSGALPTYRSGIMKAYLILAFIVVAGGSVGDLPAQTQSAMNAETASEFRAADEALNTVYRQILEAYAEDQVFLANLREAQRAWIAFRDAQLKMKYPDREPGYYGSIQPVCEANYLAALTQERTKALQVWLDGAVEGDTCAGSVKTNP